MIDGLIFRSLKVIPDERGRLFEILRADNKLFTTFGQAYITTTYPDIIKAWHLHKKQTDRITCIKGMIKLAVYDPREKSKTYGMIDEFYIGEYNLALVIIPPNLWHGWKCIGCVEAFILNLPSEAYNHKKPDEYRLDPKTNCIPYDWSIKHG